MPYTQRELALTSTPVDGLDVNERSSFLNAFSKLKLNVRAGAVAVAVKKMHDGVGYSSIVLFQ